MENVPIYVVAVFLAASIIVAYVESEAAAVRRDEEPLTFWGLLSLGLGGLGALLVFGAAE
jgi:hypothetical protein